MGAYVFTTQDTVFKKASHLLSLVNEDAVIAGVDYVNELDSFVRTLNISVRDVENGILIGLEVGNSIASIPNITKFFHDTVYLIDKVCDFLPCDRGTKEQYKKVFMNLNDTMKRSIRQKSLEKKNRVLDR